MPTQFRDASGQERLLGTIYVPGATVGDVFTVQANGSLAPAPGGGSQPDTLNRSVLVFTETDGAGTYTATVDLPDRTKILAVAAFVTAGPWSAGTAVLTVGDDDQAGGYIDAKSLVTAGQLVKPYDPTTAHDDLGESWTDPAEDGAAYEQASALYSSYESGQLASGVPYPDGGTITATVVTTNPDLPLGDSGPIVASDVSLGAGGSGYAPGDTGGINSPDNPYAATYVVDTVDGGGAVLTYHLSDPGNFSFVGDPVPTAVTTGGGDGTFAVNITEIDPQPIGPVAAANVSAGQGGSGYAPGDTGTLNPWIADDNATYVVDTVDGGGAVTAFTVTFGGTNYGSPQPASATHVTSGGGDGAMLADITELGPLPAAGVLAVEVVGFGVPAGVVNAVKS